MKALALFVVLMCVVGLVNIARAEGNIVGPDCTLTWDPPTSGPAVDGYRVYVGSTSTVKTQRAETVNTTISCADLNLSEGQHYAHVTAYNVAGESGESNTLPFVVTGVPGVPANLRLVD